MVNSIRLKQAAQVQKSQGAVWQNIQRVQQKSATNSGASYNSTSLQLTLENPKFRQSIQAYTDSIRAQITDKQLRKSIGCIYALHGQFHSSDSFVNRDLFKKMWPKLLNAMAAEAIAEYNKDKKSQSLAKVNYIKAIDEALSGKEKTEDLGKGNKVSMREGKKNVSIVTTGTVDGSEQLLHQNITPITDDFKTFNEILGNNYNDVIAGGVSLQVNF